MSTCRCATFYIFILSSRTGIYTYAYAAERNEQCVVCSQVPKELVMDEGFRLSQLMEHLSSTYQMKAPGVTTTDENGKNRTLYLPNPASIEERTRPNLKKTLKGFSFFYIYLSLLSAFVVVVVATDVLIYSFPPPPPLPFSFSQLVHSQ